MPHDLDKSCEEKGQCRNLKIVKIRVRSVWLGHGSYAAPGSFFTGLFTRNTITHWWVEIETESKGEWFCAQFWKPDITLTKHNSLSEVTEVGKKAADRSGDVCITNKSVFEPKDLTMGDVYDWMKTYNGNYDLIVNNCQDFGEAFIRRYGTYGYVCLTAGELLPCHYWTSGNSVRKAASFGKKLVFDDSLTFNGFNKDEDEIFHLDNKFVYWKDKRKNTIARGSISDGKLSVDSHFNSSPNNQFDSTDRFFAVDGRYVYWQSGDQIRRREISDGRLVRENDAKCRETYSVVDRFFCKSENYLYWQYKGTVRRSVLATDGSITSKVDQNFICNSFDERDRLFFAQGSWLYWQFQGTVRRGIFANGSLTIDTSFSFDGFDLSDRLISVRESTIGIPRKEDWLVVMSPSKTFGP